MRRICYHWPLLAFAAGSFLVGCGKQTPRAKDNVQAPTLKTIQGPQLNTGVQPPAHSPPGLWRQDNTALSGPDRQQCDDDLFQAFDFLSQKKYAEALSFLETAAKQKDSAGVQAEIKNLRLRIDQQQGAERILRDIQVVLDRGQCEEATQLATAALKEYGATDAASSLVTLKFQADALAAVQMNDNDARHKLFREQGQSALADGNPRAAAIAFEQALQFNDDAQLRKDYDELRVKLATYDDNRQKAAELCKDPGNLEDAIALLNDAARQWDTLQIHQDLDDYNLALQNRRDRIAVADFEVRGDIGVPGADRLFAEELLPHFKGRFDLVERSRLAGLLDALKIEAGRLGEGDENQREVGRLAKVRFLVLGSVTRLGTLFVNARLVDARSGLVVQTAKVGGDSSEELVAKLPELAKLLLMSDQDRLAYEHELAQQAPPLEPVQVDKPPPPAPEVSTPGQPLPPPVSVDTNRLPDLGGVKIDDFQRFHVAAEGQPAAALGYGGEVEELWKRKAVYVGLALGDNLLRRGRPREALRFFEFGLALGPANVDLEVRVARTRPMLQLVDFVVNPPPPPRVAIVDFVIAGEPAVVPEDLRWWTPQYLASYFAPPYDVVDRGELYWWMARMGMTVKDVVENPYARRWLGRALNVRYFVLGTVTQTASFSIDTYMVDAENGCLTGRGYVHARDPWELKWRLGELAQLTQTPPALWKQQQQGYRDYENLVVRAQDSMNKGDFSGALVFLRDAQQLRPRSNELQFYVQRANELGGQRALEEQHQKEFERQQALVPQRKRTQDELAREAQRYCDLAAKDAENLGQEQRLLMEKKRDTDQLAAHNQLLFQARLAFKSGNVKLSVQIYESASGLHQSDDGTRELAAARAELDRLNKQHLVEETANRQAKLESARQEELATARNRLEAERKERLQQEADLRKAQEDRDNAEYVRLVDLGERQMAAAKYGTAVSCFQAATVFKKTEQVAAFLSEAMIAQARADADGRGAAARKDLERHVTEVRPTRDQSAGGAAKTPDPLAEAKTKTEDSQRDTAAAEKMKKKEAFEQALKQGRDLLGARKYDDAIKAFQLAESYQPGNPAVAGLLRQAETARADAERDAAEKLQKRVAHDQALKQGQDLLTAKKYDDAIKAFQQAASFEPGDPAAAGLLKQAETARATASRSPTSAQQKLTDYNRLLQDGTAALEAKRFPEAVKSFTDASRLMPTDPAAAAALREAQLQWAANKVPPPPTLGQLAEYNKHMQVGAALDKQRKWEDAMKAYDAALAQIPKDAKATGAYNTAAYRFHMSEGNRHYANHSFPDAVREFDAAARLFPNDPEAKAWLKKAQAAK